MPRSLGSVAFLGKMVHRDGDTIVHWIKCKIYSLVKGRPVTMGPKLDMLKSMQRSIQLL